MIRCGRVGTEQWHGDAGSDGMAVVTAPPVALGDALDSVLHLSPCPGHLVRK
jgi:hypothetical protein